ncbi:MAG: hypothetical protein NVS3B18_06740 [Candidatus Dormibacteria bacterium]
MTDSAVAAPAPQNGARVVAASRLQPQPRAQRGRRLAPAPLLVTAAYLLFGLAWVLSNPAGFAPDEPEHYIKAVGIGHGEIRGAPAPFTFLPGVDPQMLRWQNLNTRSVQVPAGMGACLYYRLPIHGRCPEGAPPPTPSRQTTYVASYPPFTYVGAAALMRLGHTTESALLLGRLATLLLSTALVGGAAAALGAGRRGGLSLLGLLAGVTPMVLFTSSELSASGPEITSGICFAAALIRLSDDRPPPRWLWPLLLFSGAVLALSRTFGPVWVGFDLGWAAALVGIRGTRLRLLAHRRWALASAATTMVAAAANLAWQLATAPRPGLGLAAVRHGVASVVKGTSHLGREAIGVFGWIDVPLPRQVYLPWVLLLTVLGATGFLLATRRERLVLLGVAAGVALLTVAVAVAIAASAPGFKMQTRYVLPVVVALPLLAGDLVRRHASRLGRPRLRLAVPAAILLVAAVQAGSLETNAQFYRHNVRGLMDFIAPPGWRPPLGWLPSIALTALGVAALAILALLELREMSPPAAAGSPALEVRGRKRG